MNIHLMRPHARKTPKVLVISTGLDYKLVTLRISWIGLFLLPIGHGLSHYDRVSHYDHYLALVLPVALSRWFPSTSEDNSIAVQHPLLLGYYRALSSRSP